MTGYRLGLTGSLLGYAVKKYRGHRAIPQLVVNELNLLAQHDQIPRSIVPSLVEMNELMAADGDN